MRIDPADHLEFWRARHRMPACATALLSRGMIMVIHPLSKSTPARATMERRLIANLERLYAAAQQGRAP